MSRSTRRKEEVKTTTVSGRVPPSESEKNKFLADLFERFISRNGFELVKYYVLFTFQGNSQDYFPDDDPISSIAEGAQETISEFTRCWYGGQFFQWLVPDDNYKMKRPETAIGPYGYVLREDFGNNTISHGRCEGGGEVHY